MPGDGRVPAGWRRRRERALLAGSGLVDRAWVAAQVGRPLADDAAALAAYVADPELSPHPLIEPEWVDRRRPWAGAGGTALGWYLADPAHRLRSPHPLVSLAAIDELVPGAREHPHGPLAAWLAHVGNDDAAVLPSRAGTPRVTLDRLRALAVDALHEPSSGGAPERAGTVGISVVLALGPDPARTVNWVRSVGEARAAGTDVELVAVGGALSRAHRVLAATLAAVYDVRRPRHTSQPLGPAAALRLGVADAAGARLVLVRPGVVPDAGAAVRLAQALDEAGQEVAVAQPLLLDRDGVVVAAGAAPGPLLAGHSPADAEALGRVEVPAAVGPVVALTPATYAALPSPPGCRTVLVPDVRFTVPAGLVGPEASEPWTTLPADAALVAEELLARLGVGRDRRHRVAEPAPRLRWTLDTAARAGAGGETWGDTHFARSLAASLRRLGQHVAVDPAPARTRWSRSLDDVVLVLRGLDRVEPTPGPLHLLWVISHPDLVEAAEAARYDAVFAASLSWSQARSRDWGTPVEPLLQCTDPALFHPGRAEPDTGAEVLFVGNSRGVVRPALAGALAAGRDVSVHGGGWGALLPDLAVTSRGVPNDELGRLYAGAGVVLNDHWADMRRDGFVSNRLFDATACASRVVSDDLPGVHALFGDAVRTFDDPAEVAGLLRGVPEDFPTHDERLGLAARVAAEHSFDHRAATLLAAALERLSPGARRRTPAG